MDNIEQTPELGELAKLNYIELQDNTYIAMAIDGMKNLCQQKILPLDIDVEDKDSLKEIVNYVYSNDYDKINIYKSNRGYTLLCYSKNKSFEEQKNILFSLEQSGVDTSFPQKIENNDFEKPICKDYFICRVGIKIRKIKMEVFDLFEENIKKDLLNIWDLLNFVIGYQTHYSHLDFKQHFSTFENRNLFFKDFVSNFKKLELYKAFIPIHEKFLEHENLAAKKYLGSITSDTNEIPEEVENIFNIYNKETGALKPNITYLI